MTIMPQIVPNTEGLVQGSATLIVLTADAEDRQTVEAYGKRLAAKAKITGEVMRAFIPAFYRALRGTRFMDLTRDLTNDQRSCIEDAVALAVFLKCGPAEAA